MFWSNWTILRERMLSLVKATIVTHNTARSTHITAWNTCCHNTAYHITMYFHWSQYCGFSKAQHTLPEDGPIGPKHIGAKRYFNCTFQHFMCLIKGCIFWWKESWSFSFFGQWSELQLTKQQHWNPGCVVYLCMYTVFKVTMNEIKCQTIKTKYWHCICHR